MAVDVPLRCACGAMRGVARGITPGRGNRLVCYCDDCQSFAHFLGDAEHILDAHGGTEIFQTSPARIELSEGRELLTCMSLEEGGLVRWYAGCCNTPVGNTLRTRKVPFVGLIHRFAGDAAARERAFGPIRGRGHLRFAKGDRTALDASAGSQLSLVLRFVRLTLAARFRGDGRRSPFFDPRTGKLAVEPRVLEAEELRRVEAARDA